MPPNGRVPSPSNPRSFGQQISGTSYRFLHPTVLPPRWRYFQPLATAGLRDTFLATPLTLRMYAIYALNLHLPSLDNLF